MTDQPFADHRTWEPVRRKSNIGLVMLAVAAAFGAQEPHFTRPKPYTGASETPEQRERRLKHSQERILAAQAKRERKAAKKAQHQP